MHAEPSAHSPRMTGFHLLRLLVVVLVTVGFVGFAPVISPAAQASPVATELKVTVTVGSGGDLGPDFVLSLIDPDDFFASSSRAAADSVADPKTYEFDFTVSQVGEYRLFYDAGPLSGGKPLYRPLPISQQYFILEPADLVGGVIEKDITIETYVYDGQPSVTVFALDEDGVALEGLDITIEPLSAGFGPTITFDEVAASDEELLRYEVPEVPEGSYQIIFNDVPEDGNLWNRAPFTPFTIGPTSGNQTFEITLTKEAADRRFEVIVQDRITRQPLEGVTLRMVHQDLLQPVDQFVTTENRNGRISAVLEDIPGGEYFLESADLNVYIPQTNVTVPRANETFFPGTIRVEGTQLDLRGQVIFEVFVPDGLGSTEALPDEVVLSVTPGIITPNATTDQIPELSFYDDELEEDVLEKSFKVSRVDNRVTITGLPLGIPLRFLIQDTNDDYVLASLDLTLSQDSNGDPIQVGPIEVLLPFGGVLTGKIDTDRNLESLQIEAKTINGQDLADLFFVWDGSFRATGLPIDEAFILLVKDVGGEGSDEPFFINGTISNGPLTINASRASSDGLTMTASRGFVTVNLDAVDDEESWTVTINPFIQIDGDTFPLPQGRTIRMGFLEQGTQSAYDVVLGPVVRGGQSLTLNGIAPGNYEFDFRDSAPESRSLKLVAPAGSGISFGDPLPISLPAGVTNAADRVLNVDAVFAFEEPSTAPSATTAIVLDDIPGSASLDFVEAPDSVVAGQNIVLDVGTEFAGEWVLVWANSTAMRLSDAWAQVRADGTVTAPVSQSLPAGQVHRFAIQDVDQNLAGWASAFVSAAPASGDGTGSSSSRRSTSSSSGGSGAVDTELESGLVIPRSAPTSATPEVSTATDEQGETTSNDTPMSPETSDEPVVESAPEVALTASPESSSSAIIWWLVGGAVGLAAIVTVMMLARRASAL